MGLKCALYPTFKILLLVIIVGLVVAKAMKSTAIIRLSLLMALLAIHTVNGRQPWPVMQTAPQAIVK